MLWWLKRSSLGLLQEGRTRRQHNEQALQRATASRLSALNYIGFHRVVLGQSEPVGARRRLEIPRLDPLPELALVVAREGGSVLLRLVAEDGEDLRVQLVLGQRHEDVGLGKRPLLPRATIQPQLGSLSLVA